MKLPFKHIVLLVFVCFYRNLIAQIQGSIVDASSHQPIPFCGVSIKNTYQSTIANENGIFSIKSDTTNAILVFHALGYKTKFESVQSFIKNKIVSMEKTSVVLNEVVVHANNDYLYNILSDCRQKIPDYKPKNVAKVYLGLETKAKQQPIELLEIYYNGYLSGVTIDSLLVKNGRMAWAATKSSKGNRYFLSLSTTMALRKINLTHKNNAFAAIPLQFNKRKMKKYFNLSIINATKEYYLIAFKPKIDSSLFFSGEVWIDKNHNLLKIHLNGKKTTIYPFIALVQDSLYNFSIQITETFSSVNGIFLPNHIDFSYHFSYKSIRDTTLVIHRSFVTNTYCTKGIMYFYDYNKPFILPHFDYDPSYDDYRKLTFIPYNSIFWKNNNKVPLTKMQKQDLGFFAKKGHLLKYNQKYCWSHHRIGIDSIDVRSNYFQNYNIIWSKNHRLTLFKSIENIKKIDPTGKIPAYLYNLNVQLLLDITRVGDSLYHNSYTIFDRHRSFYHLPRYPYTNCFINIYFDLCEIERRKMEAELPRIGYSLEEINAIYKKANENMKSITKRYLKEVYLGKNIDKLKYWNNYVKEHLGIDNMKIFGEEMQRH